MVSSCLAGIPCRYDGGHKENRALKKMVESQVAIPLCPEMLGGLPAPRNPAEIVGGDGKDVWSGTAKVMDNSGTDVTEIYKEGARKTLEQLRELGVEQVILKEKSPSCGACQIYDGTFSGELKEGVGVTAAYLQLNGMQVVSDEQFSDEK